MDLTRVPNGAPLALGLKLYANAYTAVSVSLHNLAFGLLASKESLHARNRVQRLVGRVNRSLGDSSVEADRKCLEWSVSKGIVG
jgi:hypothetical protein